MDYTRPEDCTIFYLKFLQALFCQKDIVDFLEEAKELGIHTTSIPLLEITRDLVKAYTKGYSLPEEISYNIFYFVQEGRFAQEEEDSLEEKKVRCDVCNEIISAINSSKGKREYPFFPALINHFYINLVERTLSHAAYNQNPESLKDFLRDCTSIEYYILFSHTSLVEEKDFMSYGWNFLLNDVYLHCVQLLLRDIPLLRKDETFLGRVSVILDYNDALKREADGHPDENCDCTLEEDDSEIVNSKAFWKLQKKLKQKVLRYQKDS